MELVVTTVITVLVKGFGIKGIIRNIDIGAIRSEYVFPWSSVRRINF